MRFKWNRYRKIKFKPLYSSKVLKRRCYSVLQVILIAILIILAFVISCSGFYVKPILLIPIAISLAVFFEDELKSALVGGLCGILVDIAYYKLFGFNGVLLLVGCVFTTLIFKNYLKPMFVNTIITVAVFTFAHGFIDYFFYYRIWYPESADVIYYNYTLPSSIMTLISVVVVYPIVKSIRVKLIGK